LSVLPTLWTAITEISAAEWVAVVFALGYLVLAIRQNPLCWASSIVSSSIFLVLFWRGGLVMQAALQVFYVAMGFYGWWAWSRGGEAHRQLPVSRWPLRWHLTALAVVAVISAVNGRWVAGAGDGFVPYVDSLTAWASFFATWLVARKVLENWLYWIVTDLVAAGLYFSQGLRATTVLFVIYSMMAVRGYLQWRADLQKAEALEAREAHA
jgi:nicotinamide mononucleotide transporter